MSAQMEIEECIAIAEHECAECQDPATCEAENVCWLEMLPDHPVKAQWDNPERM